MSEQKRVEAAPRESTERVEQQLRAAPSRDRFRASLAYALREVVDPTELQRTACRLLAEHLGAARVHYAEVSEDGQHAVVAGEYRAGGVTGVLTRYRFDAYGPAAMKEFRSGRTLVVEDVGSDPRLAPEERAATAALGIGSYVIQPLMKDGRPAAVLVVRHSEPRPWGPDELELVLETAERTWTAVERARAERSLRESEERLRVANEQLSVERRKLEAVIRTLPVGVGLTDALANPLSMNDAALRMLGFASDEEMLHHLAAYPEIMELRDLEGRPIAFEEWPASKAARGEYVTGVELRLANLRAGTERTIEISAVPVRDSRGATTLVVHLMHDVTERRRAEEVLREQERRYRSLFESSLDAIYVTRHDGTILDANRAACAMHGMTVEEIRARGRAGLIVPDERLAAFLDERARRGHARGEVAMRRADGTTFPAEIQSVIVDPAGRGFTTFVIARDITERRRAEEELRALAARLDQALEQERTRIARDLHDDMGQLLAALKLDLRWIERGLDEIAGPDAVAPLHDRVVTASALVDQVVATVQRIASDLRPAGLERIGLGAALVHEARRFQERTGVAAEVRAPEAVRLPAEPSTALYRIAQEALTNVARHANASRVVISLVLDGGAVVLSVEDDGVGLGAPPRPGALGLVGMRERAHRLGGELRVESRAPRGTRITVRVPGAAP